MKAKTLAVFAFLVSIFAGSVLATMTYTAATIDTRPDVLADFLPADTPVTMEDNDDGQLVIVLSTNITGSLTIPADLGPVAIDLNGWSITGTNGVDGTETTFGGAGGAAVIVKGASGADAGATRITVKNDPWVQLWKNGPYFATSNVGATKPEESGYYFWWGDTVGYKRVGSSWDAADGSKTGFSFEEANCPTYAKNRDTLLADGYIDASGNLAAVYDAATAYLGAPWRMMTESEQDTLRDSSVCKWTWTDSWEETGAKGWIVSGKQSGYTDKSVFLPAVGFGKNARPRKRDLGLLLVLYVAVGQYLQCSGD